MATEEKKVKELQDMAESQLEEVSMQEFLSLPQINNLLEVQDADEIQRLMEGFLNVQDPETNLKEAVLVDYYVSGFCWGKDRNFNLQQLSGLMGLLHLLMENLQDKRLSLAENILELARALRGIGHSILKDKARLTFFNVDEAKDIINYLKISLFQHYKLYECMFTVPRDQMVIGAEQEVEVVKPVEAPFPLPLEEGIPYEMYARFRAPPVPGEDIETVETQLLLDIRMSCAVDMLDCLSECPKMVITEGIRTQQRQKAEINEKLRVQEEAFTSKIENLQKP
ncbi:ciliary-associated calcium-binding coiled-coil protein 1 isoform X1 [Hyla sarda]|uniref:ciliary-associated calcium-binding coiled-coil protein 1 isoform X1 n=1 Tax=Hyla sarda TaxID=327740 RepID=UPI0024C26484|nr:ciliary-associated calcium-binding coiled-coil protein 1 isoform X1 [Hyla sarda]